MVNMSDYGLLNTTGPQCLYQGTQNMESAFWLVLVLGTSFCIIGLAQNIFISYLLLGTSKFRKSSLYYLAILALLDTFLCADWILVQSVQVYFDYAQSYRVYYLWLSYIRILFTAAMVCMISCVYLILFALFETYLEICSNNACLRKVYDLMNKNRSWVALGALVLPMLLHCSRYAEIVVVEHANCTGFERYSLGTVNIFADKTLNLLFTFYIRNVFDTLIPFFLLLYMNSSIFIAVKSKGSSGDMKNATRALWADVLEYLISNVLNVVMTFWETIDIVALVSYHTDFYIYGTDAVNILTILSRCLRLPIYCFCNSEIMAETRKIFSKIFGRGEGLSLTLAPGEVMKLVNYDQPSRTELNPTSGKDDYGTFDEIYNSTEAYQSYDDQVVLNNK